MTDIVLKKQVGDVPAGARLKVSHRQAVELIDKGTAELAPPPRELIVPPEPKVMEEKTPAKAQVEQAEA